MGVQNATASIAGSSSVTATATVLAAAVVAIAGLSATTDACAVQAFAHSSMAGSSAFTDNAHDTDEAAASMAGGSSFTALGKVVVSAAAVLAGHSSTNITASFDGQEAVASLVAAGLFYVDPTKVTVIKFFSPTSVPPAFVAPKTPPVRPQAPAGSQTSVSISLNRTPPKTQKGGVPNEG